MGDPVDPVEAWEADAPDPAQPYFDSYKIVEKFGGLRKNCLLCTLF